MGLEFLDQAVALEELESPRVHDESTTLVGAHWARVDDAEGDVLLGELQREHPSRGAGADDKNIGFFIVVGA